MADTKDDKTIHKSTATEPTNENRITWTVKFSKSGKYDSASKQFLAYAATEAEAKRNAMMSEMIQHVSFPILYMRYYGNETEKELQAKVFPTRCSDLQFWTQWDAIRKGFNHDVRRFVPLIQTWTDDEVVAFWTYAMTPGSGVQHYNDKAEQITATVVRKTD